MKVFQIILILLAGAGWFGHSAYALDERSSDRAEKSKSKTEIPISISATIPSGQTSIAVYLVPAGRTFVLIQACTESITGIGPRLVGSQLGNVPATSETCTHYIPGVIFKSEESITCELPFPAITQGITCLLNGSLR